MNPLQDSDLTSIPLQGRVRSWSYCISIILKTVTLVTLRFIQPLNHERNPLQDFSSHRYTITRPNSLMEPLYLYNTKDCDSTSHLAFAPPEKPLQYSDPNGFTITMPSYCMEQLRLCNAEYCDATLHPASGVFTKIRTFQLSFFIFPFKTWTAVHDQKFASAQRKDDGTVETAVTIAFI
ncbi:hypothetical protein TNCV_1359071 [Trichonephila clavipes]|nr:hypothetical protein TNCV_1359071 [Trichonephila clavipes]